ncbi:MAG TPA: PsiF family protein [Xanthobacteraceae bacterium]|jgi:hypothetical protein|nr:PsiF family protein [Xanthobacteraceae bacterium]
MTQHVSRIASAAAIVGLAVPFLCVLSVPGSAQGPSTASTCSMQAKDKKLAGAALNSFMTKCQKDAQSDCNKQATEKKLSGAAKTSFTKKCVSDQTGT